MRHKLTEFLQWNLDITEPLYNEVLIHYNDYNEHFSSLFQ